MFLLNISEVIFYALFTVGEVHSLLRALILYNTGDVLAERE